MSESSENSEAHSAAEAQRKLAQHHIERIKKEEEEEQWISGEELYTEGSSDEDDAALRAKRRGKAARKNRRATPSKVVKQKEEQPMLDSAASLETPTTSSSSNHLGNPDAVLNTLTAEPKLEGLSLLDEGSTNKSEPSTSSGLHAESDHTEISWRPKRGSIKLPNINSEDDNGEVVTKINKQNNWTLSDIFENVSELRECMSSESQDSADEFFNTVEAFRISHAQADVSRPQNEKSCHGETSDLQSAFLEMEKYDKLLEFMAKKEREARETTNQLTLQIRNKLIELKGSQKLNGQLARNIKSFIQLQSEEANDQDKPLVLPNLNEDKKRNVKAAALMDNYTSKPQKQQAVSEQRPKSTDADTKTKSVLTRRVQSAVAKKKNEVNFIQRNIESVSANVGVALTDEEKEELAVLLKEIEGLKKDYGSSGDSIKENCLFHRRLNVKIGEMSMTDVRKKGSAELEENLETKTAFAMLTKEENEKVKHLLEEQESDEKYKYTCSKQLTDIDKSLTALQSTALEEVDPVGEDEIRNLLSDYYKENSVSPEVCIKPTPKVMNIKTDAPIKNLSQNLHEEKESSSKSILDAETLKSLLSQAYKDLPNFKYKYKV